MFEILERDAAGRIGRWAFGNHKITTPEIAIVVNPNRLTVEPKELQKEFGAKIIITNAYIIKRSDKFEDICSRGLHKHFKWTGPIYTDSGTYQMHSRGKVQIRPEETLDIQKAIGSDIITPLDVFTEPSSSHRSALDAVNETAQRVNMAREHVKEQQLVGPIQGGLYPDLRKRSAEATAKANPDVFAIGGIVPLMEQYRFRELIEVIIACKSAIPSNRPVHAFGAGHPMVFSLLVACGVDIFDSAAYALYARDGRYMTPYGTLKVDELTDLPCECPVCSSHTPRELDVNLIARHNLYATFAEIRRIHQAIRAGRLWNLVEHRAHTNPALYQAYKTMVSKYTFFEKKECMTKKHPFMYFEKTSLRNPYVKRAINRATKIKSKQHFLWYGKKIPDGLCIRHPFSSSIPAGEQNKTFSHTKPRELVRRALQFQYGEKAEGILLKNSRMEVSKKTGRVRRAFTGDDLLGTIRANDGVFVPTVFGANKIISKTGNDYSVMISDDAVPFAKDGKSVFSKFVVSAGRKIRSLDEVFVVDSKKNVIACGTAILNAEDMIEFTSGIAVKVRHS